MRRRLHLACLLLVVAAGGGVGTAAAQKEHPRGQGPRFLDVGFEINPFSKYSQMRAGGDAPAGEEAGRPHRFNVSVDAGNYVSLRAFLGRMGDRMQDRVRDDSGDGDLPSVEAFLERLRGTAPAARLRQPATAAASRQAAAAAESETAEVGEDGAARRLNVYAKDQRVLFNWDVYPDRAFGKLMFPASYYCTGQLIGKRYVLTAAHCFYSYGKQVDGNNMYHSQFRAAYHTVNGVHYYAATSSWGRLWYGTTYPEVYRNSDWAIIELEEPLGETQGYLGINPTDLRKQLPIYDKFQLIGYSEDGYSQTAGKDPQCSLEDAYQGVYFHNCDCAAGASGGALLDPSFNIVGINTAHVMPQNPTLLRAEDYNPTYPNIAVPAYQYMPTYAHILTQMS